MVHAVRETEQLQLQLQTGQGLTGLAGQKEYDTAETHQHRIGMTKLETRG
jgi:hypothetical protein